MLQVFPWSTCIQSYSFYSWFLFGNGVAFWEAMENTRAFSSDVSERAKLYRKSSRLPEGHPFRRLLGLACASRRDTMAVIGFKQLE